MAITGSGVYTDASLYQNGAENNNKNYNVHQPKMDVEKLVNWRRMVNSFSVTLSREGVFDCSDGLAPFRAAESDMVVILCGYFRFASMNGRYSFDAEEFYQHVTRLEDRKTAEIEGSFCAVLFNGKKASCEVYTDPFGTRPVYYTMDGEEPMISTDIVTLARLVPGDLRLTRKGLAETAFYGFSLPGDSLFEGVKKCPSNAMTVITSEGHVSTIRFRNRLVFLKEGKESLESAVEKIDIALEKDFRHMAENARTAAVLLSGGIDSSLLAHYASRSFDTVIAYSCEIEGYDNPELERARHVARVLNLEHKIIRLEKRELPFIFEEVCERMGEPTRHINNLVTRAIFRKVDEVDVIVGGDGADALFGTVYQKAIVTFDRRGRLLRWLPRSIRHSVSQWLGRHGSGKRRQLADLLWLSTDDYVKRRYAVDFNDNERAFLNRQGLHLDQVDLVPPESRTALGRSIEINAQSFLSCMLQRNSKLSSDRRSLVYYPFLSDELIELSKGVSDSLRFDNRGHTKKPLVELCRRKVDAQTADQSKIGFTTPEKDWLTGDLALYSDQVLNSIGLQGAEVGIEILKKDKEWLVRSSRAMWWLMGLNQMIYLENKQMKEKTYDPML